MFMVKKKNPNICSRKYGNLIYWKVASSWRTNADIMAKIGWPYFDCQKSGHLAHQWYWWRSNDTQKFSQIYPIIIKYLRNASYKNKQTNKQAKKEGHPGKGMKTWLIQVKWDFRVFWACGQHHMGTFSLLFIYGTLPLWDFLVVSRMVMWIRNVPGASVNMMVNKGVGLFWIKLPFSFNLLPWLQLWLVRIQPLFWKAAS